MVYSIAGRDLLGPVHLEPQHSMEHVSRLAAAALGVPHCKLVSQVGLTLASSMTVQACGLDDGDVITAVAPKKLAEEVCRVCRVWAATVRG